MNFIRYIIQYFRRPRHNVTVRQTTSQDPPRGSDDPSPGYLPIESYYDMHRIPGTTLDIGIVVKVIQTPANEIVTANQTKGIHCGCGHHIYRIDEVMTAESIHPGLGGQCPFCAAKATDLYNQNLISLQQAEEMSLHCSQCQSHCDLCRRNNVCARHTREFQQLDGTILLLCTECLAKAENDKFFKKTIAFMLYPFVDYRRLPPPKSTNPYEGY